MAQERVGLHLAIALSCLVTGPLLFKAGYDNYDSYTQEATAEVDAAYPPLATPDRLTLAQTNIESVVRRSIEEISQMTTTQLRETVQDQNLIFNEAQRETKAKNFREELKFSSKYGMRRFGDLILIAGGMVAGLGGLIVSAADLTVLRYRKRTRYASN